MTAVAERRGSGLPWVGTIPSDWGVLPLVTCGTATHIKNSGLIETNLLSLSYGNIVRRNIDSPEGLVPSSYETYQIVEPGDVVFRFTDLQNDKRSLRSALVRERGIITSAYLAFRPTQVHAPYLAHLMRAYDVAKVFYGMGGGVRQSLNFDDVKRLPILIPGRAEQRRIADYLDVECARLDRLIELRERHMTLVHEHSVSELDEIVNYHAARAVRLGRLATIQSGITVDGSRADSGAEEVPYLRVANVQAGALDLSEVKTIPVSPVLHARYLLRDGDVLMTEGGDLDKLGRGTVWRSEIPGAIHQNHVFAVRPRNDALLSDYLAVVTASSPARRHFESTGSKTTNLASTSSSKVLDLPVPLRPLADQQAIVGRARACASQAEAPTSKMARSIALLRERKQALITAAVTGVFDVSAASGRGA